MQCQILFIISLYMYWFSVEYVSWHLILQIKISLLWVPVKIVVVVSFLQAIMEQANRCGNDLAKLKDILSSILLICKVFYSLNFQVIIFMPS